MNQLSKLRVEIYADGADINEMLKVRQKGLIKGFTTNPTLMRKAGINDYEKFAKEVLQHITDMPISFEVFSDEFENMEKEAHKIATWGKNVVIKIPITNTKGESSISLIRTLSEKGFALNITAILTERQVEQVITALPQNSRSIISVFAGRIADTGRDPVPIMKKCANILEGRPTLKLLWASTRELFNIFQAEQCNCSIITVTNDILKKIDMIGKDLEELSLDTVKMFYNDARESKFDLLGNHAQDFIPTHS